MGFTLAEVLITLGIIGVVAAITIPSLINDAQDKQFKAMLKKQYSTIGQALQMVYAKEGENLDLGNFTQATWTQMVYFICRLGDELKTVKSGVICTEDNLSNTATMKYNQDVKWHENETWFNKRKEKMVLNNGYNHFTLVMSDGALINFNCGKLVFIDVNGYKNPNTVGRDIFYFLLNDNQLSPVFWTSDKGNAINGCSGSAYSTKITPDNYKEDCETGSGWGCSPLYIME